MSFSVLHVKKRIHFVALYLHISTFKSLPAIAHSGMTSHFAFPYLHNWEPESRCVLQTYEFAASALTPESEYYSHNVFGEENLQIVHSRYGIYVQLITPICARHQYGSHNDKTALYCCVKKRTYPWNVMVTGSQKKWTKNSEIMSVKIKLWHVLSIERNGVT